YAPGITIFGSAQKSSGLPRGVVIEGVQHPVIEDPAPRAEMGARVNQEVFVLVPIGEAHKRDAVIARERHESAVVHPAGLSTDSEILVVDALDGHAQQQRFGAKLAHASEQELEIGPLG